MLKLLLKNYVTQDLRKVNLCIFKKKWLPKIFDQGWIKVVWNFLNLNILSWRLAIQNFSIQISRRNKSWSSMCPFQLHFLNNPSTKNLNSYYNIINSPFSTSLKFSYKTSWMSFNFNPIRNLIQSFKFAFSLIFRLTSFI